MTRGGPQDLERHTLSCAHLGHSLLSDAQPPPPCFRGLAMSLKQLSMRIRSTTSTAKITKAMKMVAAAKLKGAESLDNGIDGALVIVDG